VVIAAVGDYPLGSLAWPADLAGHRLAIKTAESATKAITDNE
jgi:hypothetical protein